MKKYIHLIILPFLFSCKKEPPLPAPVVSFAYSAAGGGKVLFYAGGSGYSELEWDFGNGRKLGGMVLRPVSEYTKEGTYLVTLVGKNKDGSTKYSANIVVQD